MLFLTIRTPGEPPRRVSLDRTTLTLGRASASDLAIADRTLSRTHAKIDNASGVPVLVDLQSRNGTLVNGTRIVEPTPLRSGDRISLGETTIDVGLESAAQVVIGGTNRSTAVEHTLFRSSKDLVDSHREAAARALGAEELSRLNESLRILNEVSVALLADVSTSSLLGTVLEKVFAYLQPDRGLLMLADASGRLKPEAMKFADGLDASNIHLSQTLVSAVMKQRNAVLMVDTTSDVQLGSAESIRLSGVTSVLAAPLFVGEKVMGLIYLEARLGRKSFTEDDLRLLTSLANTAAIKLENVRLQEEAAAKHRIEREMSLAWEVQRRLLPERAPERPGSELFGRTIPSRTVSGDYYDFFERPDGAVDVAVADVCGKGMGASILAASVQAAFQAWASEGFPPEKLCSRLNDLVFRRTSPEKFVTFLTALYDPRTGTVIYTNAGHNPALVVRKDGGVERLDAHGLPLGLFPAQSYASGSVTLGAGDLLVLYTDGITEAANPSGDEFGVERLTEVVLAHRDEPLEDLEQTVTDSLDAFAQGTPFGDDRTLVLLRRTG